MGKSSVTPIDLLHNASNYITLKLDDTNYMQWSYQDIILLILKGLPVEYNPFKSHIRARPVRVTLPELCDLLLEEECDLDDAVKFFNSPIMIAMVAQKGTVSLSPHVAHGDNFHSGLVDRGVANPNWQLNWNQPTNYRGRGSWSRGKSWNNGGRGNTWNNNGGGNNGPNWNGSTNKWNHGGQSGNSYGQWNQGSGSWNNNAGFNNTGSWHSTSGPWHLRGNSGSFTQYFVSPNSSPGVLSPSPMAPPVSTVASSLATETCQICLQFGHTTPNCPHRTNFSYQGIPPSPALTALTATASGSFSDPNIWLIDSGATNHMTSDLQLLSNITPSTSTDNVTISMVLDLGLLMLVVPLLSLVIKSFIYLRSSMFLILPLICCQFIDFVLIITARFYIMHCGSKSKICRGEFCIKDSSIMVFVHFQQGHLPFFLAWLLFMVTKCAILCGTID
ncbi:unnamed protein product [Prunus armeniaca]|uniref:Retrotransposon Copia-like N-terminal domain-containing protein n=1 Tax=Prunus armeniaca TaxID=36596 RepID=A0A6J5TGY6_PRUAR|nr:unnamed protein product [Prunus armeniaca]